MWPRPRPLLGEIFVRLLVILHTKLCSKFEVYSSSSFGDMFDRMPKILGKSRDLGHAHFSARSAFRTQSCIPNLKSVAQVVFEILHFKRIGVTSLTFQGHVTSSVTWPFDSPHAISYWWSFGTNSSISNGFGDIQRQRLATIHNVTDRRRWQTTDATQSAKNTVMALRDPTSLPWGRIIPSLAALVLTVTVCEMGRKESVPSSSALEVRKGGYCIWSLCCEWRYVVKRKFCLLGEPLVTSRKIRHLQATNCIYQYATFNRNPSKASWVIMTGCRRNFSRRPPGIHSALSTRLFD